MINATVKIKDGFLRLPQEARPRWQDAEVFVHVAEDMISIKRFAAPSPALNGMMDEWQDAARAVGVREKDVDGALRDVRRAQEA
jgi:hypothetical protein